MLFPNTTAEDGLRGRSEELRTPWRGSIPALLALALVAAIVRHLPFHLDEYDQAKQAYAAYEIVRGGSVFFQHAQFGGEATKPPLLAMISAALYLLTGSWEVAWRAPSLAAVMAILWMLWRWGERRLPRLGGAIAALSFALTQITTRLALMVRTDALLAFWWTAMALLLLRRIELGMPWRIRDRVGLALLLTGALFTKGPVIFAFAAMPLLAAVSIPRRAFGPTAAIRTGVSAWLIPFLLFLGWVAAGSVREDSFTDTVIVREFGQSFRFNGSVPLWLLKSLGQYPAQLFLRCLPWTAAALLLWRRSSLWRSLWREPIARHLALTAGAGLAIMSTLSAHRADRLFPLLPLFSLLLVEMARVKLRECADDRRWALGRRWTVRVGWVAAAIWLGYAATQSAVAYRRGDDGLIAFGRDARAWAESKGWRLAVDREVALHTGMVIYAGLDHRQVLPAAFSLTDPAIVGFRAVIAFASVESEAAARGWETVLRSHSGRSHREQCVLLRPADVLMK